MERYEYIGQAGSGAYGQVWVCRVRPLPEGEEAICGLHEGMLVACKVFRQAHTDKEIMRLALREVRVLKAINHDNCVRLLDAFKSKSGKVYLIFEYVEGCAYKELCKYRMGLPPAALKLLAFQLCLALRYLHGEKIVHRDLKPSNILISAEGVLKLCDFGFARFTSCIDPRDAQRLSTYVVTRWYRAPEVLLSLDYGPAADIWALGCTIAELAVGEPLMPGTSTLDQLWRIMRVFGPLPPHMASRMGLDPRLALLRVPPRGRTLAMRLPIAGYSLGQFLEACLRLDPTSRMSAEELLHMPYFFEIPQLVAGTPLELLVARELQPRRQVAAAAAPPPHLQTAKTEPGHMDVASSVQGKAIVGGMAAARAPAATAVMAVPDAGTGRLLPSGLHVIQLAARQEEHQEQHQHQHQQHQHQLLQQQQHQQQEAAAVGNTATATATATSTAAAAVDVCEGAVTRSAHAVSASAPKASRDGEHDDGDGRAATQFNAPLSVDAVVEGQRTGVLQNAGAQLQSVSCPPTPDNPSNKRIPQLQPSLENDKGPGGNPDRDRGQEAAPAVADGTDAIATGTDAIDGIATTANTATTAATTSVADCTAVALAAAAAIADLTGTKPSSLRAIIAAVAAVGAARVQNCSQSMEELLERAVTLFYVGTNTDPGPATALAKSAVLPQLQPPCQVPSHERREQGQHAMEGFAGQHQERCETPTEPQRDATGDMHYACGPPSFKYGILPAGAGTSAQASLSHAIRRECYQLLQAAPSVSPAAGGSRDASVPALIPNGSLGATGSSCSRGTLRTSAAAVLAAAETVQSAAMARGGNVAGDSVVSQDSQPSLKAWAAVAADQLRGCLAIAETLGNPARLAGSSAAAATGPAGFAVELPCTLAPGLAANPGSGRGGSLQLQAAVPRVLENTEELHALEFVASGICGDGAAVVSEPLQQTLQQQQPVAAAVAAATGVAASGTSSLPLAAFGTPEPWAPIKHPIVGRTPAAAAAAAAPTAADARTYVLNLQRFLRTARPEGRSEGVPLESASPQPKPGSETKDLQSSGSGGSAAAATAAAASLALHAVGNTCGGKTEPSWQLCDVVATHRQMRAAGRLSLSDTTPATRALSCLEMTEQPQPPSPPEGGRSGGTPLAEVTSAPFTHMQTSSIRGLSGELGDVLTPVGAPQLPSCTGITYPHRRPVGPPANVNMYDFTNSPFGSGSFSPYDPAASAAATPTQCGLNVVIPDLGSVTPSMEFGASLTTATSMGSPGALLTPASAAVASAPVNSAADAATVAALLGPPDGRAVQHPSASDVAAATAEAAAVTSADGRHPAAGGTAAGSRTAAAVVFTSTSGPLYRTAAASRAVQATRRHVSSRFSTTAMAAAASAGAGRRLRDAAQPIRCSSDRGQGADTADGGAAIGVQTAEATGGEGYRDRSTAPGIAFLSPPSVSTLAAASAPAGGGGSSDGAAAPSALCKQPLSPSNVASVVRGSGMVRARLTDRKRGLMAWKWSHPGLGEGAAEKAAAIDPAAGLLKGLRHSADGDSATAAAAAAAAAKKDIGCGAAAGGGNGGSKEMKAGWLQKARRKLRKLFS